jgi:hypothetical protein
MSINYDLKPIVESKEAVLGAKIFREAVDPAMQYHLKAVLTESANVAMSEDVVGKVKAHFGKHWKKYVAGAVTAGAGALAYKNRDQIKQGYNKFEKKAKAKVKELRADLKKALDSNDENKAQQIKQEMFSVTENTSKLHEILAEAIAQESKLGKIGKHLKTHWKKYALGAGAVAGAVAGGKYAYDKYKEKQAEDYKIGKGVERAKSEELRKKELNAKTPQNALERELENGK